MLILAREIGPQVDRVVEELTARGVPVFRTDLAAFPQTLSVAARLDPDGWNGTLATEHRAVRLGDIRSIWYRHPAHFQLADGMSRPERRHAARMSRSDLRPRPSSTCRRSTCPGPSQGGPGGPPDGSLSQGDRWA